MLLDLNILCFGFINKGELKATELSYGHGLVLEKSKLGLTTLYLLLPVLFCTKINVQVFLYAMGTLQMNSNNLIVEVPKSCQISQLVCRT